MIFESDHDISNDNMTCITDYHDTSPDELADAFFELEGIIIQRRSFGKHLAFANIKTITIPPTNTTPSTENDYCDNSRSSIINKYHNSKEIRIVFRSKEMISNNFPTKTSMLPYGATIWVRLKVDNHNLKNKNISSSSINNKNHHPSNKGTPPKREKGEGMLYCVMEWKLIDNVKQLAEEKATNSKASDGILYSVYLQERANLYFSHHQDRKKKKKEKEKKESDQFLVSAENNMNTNNDKEMTTKTKTNLEKDEDDDDRNEIIDNKTSSSSSSSSPTSTKVNSNNNIVSPISFYHTNFVHQTSSSPAKIFAQFIVEHYPTLRTVMDVAGGKGYLSKALSTMYDIQSIVVDPMIRKQNKKNKKKYTFLSTYFNRTTFLQQYEELIIKEVDCFVALHPDEATEDVLDVALRYNKSVAIVPCCVFPSLFPHRRLIKKKIGQNDDDDDTTIEKKEEKEIGTLVTSYDDFCSYLLRKDSRLRIATLPFQGRNQVIFM